MFAWWFGIGRAWALKCAMLSYDVVADASPAPPGAEVTVHIGAWTGTGPAGPDGALAILVTTDAYERGHWFLAFPLGCSVPGVRRVGVTWGDAALGAVELEAVVRREDRRILVVRRFNPGSSAPAP